MTTPRALCAAIRARASTSPAAVSGETENFRPAPMRAARSSWPSTDRSSCVTASSSEMRLTPGVRSILPFSGPLKPPAASLQETGGTIPPTARSEARSHNPPALTRPASSTAPSPKTSPTTAPSTLATRAVESCGSAIARSSATSPSTPSVPSPSIMRPNHPPSSTTASSPTTAPAPPAVRSTIPVRRCFPPATISRMAMSPASPTRPTCGISIPFSGRFPITAAP